MTKKQLKRELAEARLSVAAHLIINAISENALRSAESALHRQDVIRLYLEDRIRELEKESDTCHILS